MVLQIHIEVDEAGIGQRLDQYLGARPEAAAESLSRTRIQALIGAGHVRLDGSPAAQAKLKLRMGQKIEIDVPEAGPAEPRGEKIPLDVVYEDDALIVLDKPAGLVVHPGAGNETGTLVNALIAHCGDSLSGIGGVKRPGIVHRLDKDTSGVMVVAKSEAALASLSALFAARDMERAYLALVWGVMAPPAGEIEGAIGRDPRDRKRMALVARGGRAALTYYKTLAVYGGCVSLVECRLATGRTHQIRVHLASRGHPVVGDPVYLRRIPAVSKSLAEPVRRLLLDFPRQALHARSLGFKHPATGQSLLFETPVPADFQALLDCLATV